MDKFWSKVDKGSPSSCWPWVAATRRDGYGVFKMDGKLQAAHRVAYKLHYEVDPGSLYVCHACDNKKCCNPAHLWLGTAKDNSMDMAAKGRQGLHKEPWRASRGESHWTRKYPELRPVGSANGHSKVTEDDVREIRRAAAAGVSRKALEAKYGLSRSQVCVIVNRKQWSHIK